jgi:hypothetical protein
VNNVVLLLSIKGVRAYSRAEAEFMFVSNFSTDGYNYSSKCLILVFKKLVG